MRISLSLIFLLLVLTACQKKNDSVEPEDDNEYVFDLSGNKYKIVEIGNQTWMAENLKVSKFNDGTTINLLSSDDNWKSNAIYGGSCFYDNDPNNNNPYGRLYNRYAITDNRKIAPNGWHIPTNAEWDTLISYLGGKSSAAGKLKETGFSHWKTPNAGASNSTNFTSVPAGLRNTDGSFSSLGYSSCYWSAEGYVYILYNDEDIVRTYIFSERNGVSVRCIKNK